jgi:phosphoribosylcarboxyaminoimidazole (NCAIR) mutase
MTRDESVLEKTLQGFAHCATIASYHGLSETLNHILISLCKYSLKCVEAVEELGPAAAVPTTPATAAATPVVASPLSVDTGEGTSALDLSISASMSVSGTHSLLVKRALMTLRCTLTLAIGAFDG